jgi:inosine/xanthosine triphosphate pyrophosphatase family protein
VDSGRQRDTSPEAQRLAEALPDILARVKDKPIVVEAMPGKPGTRMLDYDALVASIRAEKAREEEIRRLLADEAERNAEVLAAYSPRSRALRAQAARVLDRLAAVYGV